MKTLYALPPSGWIPLLLLAALAAVPTVASSMGQPFWTFFLPAS